MKFKNILISGSVIFYATHALAATTPTLELTNISTAENVAIALQASNIKNLSNIKFSGLDGVQVIGKQVSFNTSDTSSDNYSSKIFLLPQQAGTYQIAVSAEVNGKTINSAPLNLSVSNQQIQAIKTNLQKNLKQENQQMTQMQKQMNRQMQEQMQFFNNINTAIQKEQQLSSRNL